jgi:hypothetical protein
MDREHTGKECEDQKSGQKQAADDEQSSGELEHGGTPLIP